MGKALVEIPIEALDETWVAVAETRWLAGATRRWPLRAAWATLGAKKRGWSAASDSLRASMLTRLPAVGVNVTSAAPSSPVRTLAGSPVTPWPSSSMTASGTAAPPAATSFTLPVAGLPAVRPRGMLASMR